MTAAFDDYERQWNADIVRAQAEIDPRWSLTGYRGHNSRDGVAWIATIRLAGRIVGHVEQAGRGGDNEIDFLVKASGPDGYRRDVQAEQAWRDEITRLFPDEPYSGADKVLEALLRKAGK